MKKVAVILSGCGARDGSEIRETICALLALSQQNIRYQCFSIDKEQHIVYDHYNDKVSENEKRNVLVESARLARGRVKNIKELNVEEFDGILFPGGYGAALNLADFGYNKSKDFNIEKEVEEAIISFKEADKPLCFLCISPVIPAKIFGDIKITLGMDKDASKSVAALGSDVVEMEKNIPVVDEINKIVTAPCYLVELNLAELHQGIYSAVEKFAEFFRK
jgi:enhancing lycopene biosynthesis protein 2